MCVEAFVSARVAFRTLLEVVAWFPDRDYMTSYRDSCWIGLAFILFERHWRNRFAAKRPPQVTLFTTSTGKDKLY